MCAEILLCDENQLRGVLLLLEGFELVQTVCRFGIGIGRLKGLVGKHRNAADLRCGRASGGSSRSVGRIVRGCSGQGRVSALLRIAGCVAKAFGIRAASRVRKPSDVA